MKQATKSLKSRNNLFSLAQNQVAYLENGIFGENKLPTFSQTIANEGLEVNPRSLEILQVNIGYKCNQSCTHCHVDAGPDRTEMMSKETMHHCLQALSENKFSTLDITGGAPELHSDFRWFVEQARPLVDEIIVRSNLTIIESHPRFHDLPEFFKTNRVRVVSSLPCYTESNVDRQRGNGVFDASIKALQRLNSVGYGIDYGLKLDLVYNPGGASLPPSQSKLEADYKTQLLQDFGIVFNELLCMTNLPIARFLDSLVRDGKYEQYMELLVNSFNPDTTEGLMCTNTLSIDWSGHLYDCDFNQMLKLEMDKISHISDFSSEAWMTHNIRLSQHCYGCTAGEGTSCQGALI